MATHTTRFPAVSPAVQPSRLRPYDLDGARLWFDRDTGLTVVQRDEATQSLRRTAPRVVQFGVTNACNLSCGFCSRDVATSTVWDSGTSFTLLRDLAEQGTLEVAFGGGEPLAARGFDDLVRRLHEETPLGVGFTTNGILLTDERIARLVPYLTQVRLSLYPDNAWRGTAERLRRGGARYGANWIATPDSLDALEGVARDLAARGCTDLLVLAYTGNDAQMHLSAEDDARLSDKLRALSDAFDGSMRFAVDACFGSRLDVPRLLPAGDCAAGRDHVVVTSDRQLVACSFGGRTMPFDDAADLLALWRSEADRLAAPVNVGGCARRPDHGLGRAAVPNTAEPLPTGWSVWNAFASNNSGAYTLIGQFEEVQAATSFAEDLATACAEQDRWVREVYLQPAKKDGSAQPPMPLLALVEREGLASTPEGYDEWPEYGAPPMVTRVDRSVVLHADYTVSMPRAFGEWLYRRGGRVAIELNHTHRPLVVRGDFWVKWDAEDREARVAAIRAELARRFPDGLVLDDANHNHQVGVVLTTAEPADALRAFGEVADAHSAYALPSAEEARDESDPLRPYRRE